MAKATEISPDSEPAPRRFGFLLIDGFSLISFASATEPLRLANLAVGEHRYHWRTLGFEQLIVHASNGVAVAVEQVIRGDSFDEPIDALFVCGSNPVPRRIDPSVLGWLRNVAHHGIPLGGICTGSYWLAWAGLLDGYHCTLHWEDAERFLANFQKVQLSSRLFEIDRDRYTCSGGVAPVDMMLSLIARENEASKVLAATVAELMVCERIRSHDELQRVPLRIQVGANRPKLLEAVSLMESNLEEPLTLDEIARYVQLSSRQLERQFAEHLKCTPRQYYLALRLQKAQRLLRDSNASIIDVAVACGFTSVSHFISRYRERFGIPPGRERRVGARIP
ncbi:MAG: GlxA family transcriptional regulator [Lautropia sp.]|nr:GlxA family transcriptional regulator [Lautropia sp.]